MPWLRSVQPLPPSRSAKIAHVRVMLRPVPEDPHKGRALRQPAAAVQVHSAMIALIMIPITMTAMIMT